MTDLDPEATLIDISFAGGYGPQHDDSTVHRRIVLRPAFIAAGVLLLFNRCSASG